MTIYSPQARQNAVNSIVIKALERSSSTQFVGTTAEEFDKMPAWVKKNLDARHLGVIFDENTRQIAQRTVLPLLEGEDLQYSALCVENPTSHGPLTCSTLLGEAVATQLPDTIDLVVSVGSGTLTDLAKIAARTRDLPMIAIATAASMNGFTSGLAATLDDGIKLTKKAPPPRAVWAHPHTLQQAPQTMSAAGLGDLHSKAISSADWRLSHLLNATPWDPDVVEMLQTVTALSQGLGVGIQNDQRDAYAQTFAGLCLTGIAMQAATPGAQASGAEHLISHYFDMIAGSPSFDHTATDHGAQVAVGCMVALYAWRVALEGFAQGRPLKPCPTYVTNAAAKESHIRGHFQSLSDALCAMHTRAPVQANDVDRRRTMLIETQGDAIRQAANFLPTPQALRQELTRAGCPTRFKDLGVTRDLARRCITYAPWVRARYTIFHLLLECGWYEDFVDGALAETY